MILFSRLGNVILHTMLMIESHLPVELSYAD